jgi:hypothetical protein
MNTYKKFFPPISIEDLPQLKVELSINGDSTGVLQKVLNVDSTKCTLFYKYFFTSDRLIEKHSSRLIELLLTRNQMFHVVHGYSKNGKTTFIRNAINSFNDKVLPPDIPRYVDVFSMISYNFQDLNHGDFLTKIKELFINTFICNSIPEQRKRNDDLFKFSGFINVFEGDLRKSNNIAIANMFSNRFDELKIAIYNYCEESLLYLDKGKLIENKVLFKQYFTDHVLNKNVSDYFIFLVIYEIVCRREYILYSKKKYKFVFILDNIDDYLKNDDFEFLKHPQIVLSSFFYKLAEIPIVGSIFLSTLSKIYEHDSSKVAQKIFSFSEQLSFIYVFRTANFLAFANIVRDCIKNEADSSIKYYPSSILKNNYIRFTTIGNTSKIVEKRISRFFELTELIEELNIPNGFLFLRYMSENFSSAKLDDNINIRYRNIYNIWNGDKNALWTSIIDSWGKTESRYFINEKIIVELSEDFNNCFYKDYLMKGVYVRFFLDLLNDHNGFIKVMNQIIFSFRDTHLQKKVKNIRRIILNLITNESEKNKKVFKNKDLRTIENIEKAGVGLYDLLELIYKYIKTVNNKKYYTTDEVRLFFEEICQTEQIDHFAQLFSIYKSPLIKEQQEEKYTNYYNVNNEIIRFEKEGVDCKNDLNQIRLFNNNSAVYLTSSLLSNFEYFSFSIDQNTLPLIFSFRRKPEIKIATQINHFLFYYTIESVFQDVEHTINNLVDFYIESLSKHYLPSEFVMSDLFSVLMPPKDNAESNLLEGNVQFKLIIARHFTYIESFRQVVLTKNKILKDIDISEKKIINEYLLKVLDKYCELFMNNYDKILNNLKLTQNNPKVNTWQLDNDYEVRKRYRKNIADISAGKLNEYVRLHEPIDNYSKIDVIDY